MNISLSQKAVYKISTGLMVQCSMAFANYPSVLDALSDPNFEFPSSDNIAMMVCKQGEMFELNLLGAFVWELMDGTKTIDTILDKIVNMFSIEKQTAYSDLAILIENMIELGVLNLVSP